MIISIRKFLLVNLLLAITVTMSLAAVGNHYLNQRDIQLHFDSLLSHSGLSFQALVGEGCNDSNLLQIQQRLNKIPQLSSVFFDNEAAPFSTYQAPPKYHLQLWNQTGKLLLHSADTPITSLSNGNLGFNDKYLNHTHWRVFTSYDPAASLQFVIAERYDVRNSLSHVITVNDIYIILFSYPIAGLLIWLIIGRGLSSVKRVADEVSDRASNYLEPVDIHTVPVEIKPLVDELNKLFLRLQQAFDREKRFAADAAHELRTPLAAIKTQAQVALKATHEQERQALLNNVITGVDRSAHVVQQLLTLSRLVPEATNFEEMTDVNLYKLATDVIAQLAPIALQKHIEIELKSSDSQLIIQGDYTSLGILMRNLIDNAIRYTPEHGQVFIHITECSDYMVFTVEDNGPGIPAELRSRVFERFYRVLGNKSSGSGLGLAIVQQIAKLHQAEVKLGSASSGTGLVVEVKFKKHVDKATDVQ